MSQIRTTGLRECGVATTVIAAASHVRCFCGRAGLWLVAAATVKSKARSRTLAMSLRDMTVFASTFLIHFIGSGSRQGYLRQRTSENLRRSRHGRVRTTRERGLAGPKPYPASCLVRLRSRADLVCPQSIFPNYVVQLRAFSLANCYSAVPRCV